MAKNVKPRRRKPLQRMPQVAILLESSHGASRGLLRGIIKYVRLFGPWGLHITTGGPGDQQLPTLKKWGATGIIGRISHQVAVLGVDNDELICESTEPPMSSISINTEAASQPSRPRIRTSAERRSISRSTTRRSASEGE